MKKSLGVEDKKKKEKKGGGFMSFGGDKDREKKEKEGGMFSFGDDKKKDDEGFFSKVFHKHDDDNEKVKQKQSGFDGLFAEPGSAGSGGGRHEGEKGEIGGEESTGQVVDSDRGKSSAASPTFHFQNSDLMSPFICFRPPGRSHGGGCRNLRGEVKAHPDKNLLVLKCEDLEASLNCILRLLCPD